MDLLLTQPADTDIQPWFDETATPEQQQMAEILRSIRAEWPPSGHCPGTVYADGRQLTQARVNASLQDVENLISQFGLDWIVIAAQDEVTGVAERPVNPAAVLPFLPDVTEQQLRDGSVNLPKYAGHPDWTIA